MKTKLRLRKPVKITLIAIAAIGVLAMLFGILNIQYNNAVNRCVEAGNSKTYCENYLR